MHQLLAIHVFALASLDHHLLGMIRADRLPRMWWDAIRYWFGF